MVRAPTQPGVKLPSSKVALVCIAKGVRLTSNSTTTWTNVDLELDEIAHWGPWIESITGIVNTIGATTNHSYKVVQYWSVDGRNWNGPFDLFTAITAGSGSAIQTAYTGATFGPIMKYALAVRNNTGTAAETATVDVWLQITFKS